jgi:Putative zinc-finger
MKSIINAIGHIISCKEASHYVSRAQDKRLSAWERWKLKMHLKVCAKCVRFEKQIQFLREALKRYKL